MTLNYWKSDVYKRQRKGYAFHTLAEWAEAVRRNGSIPLYSASTCLLYTSLEPFPFRGIFVGQSGKSLFKRCFARRKITKNTAIHTG